MSTSFLQLYDLFLKTNQDDKFLKTLTLEQQEDILETFLLTAIMDFDSSRTDLSYDLSAKAFVNVLSLDEQRILTMYMRLYWIQRLLYDEKNLRNQMGDRDYRRYSPANQLKALSELEVTLESQIKKRIYRYKNKVTLNNHKTPTDVSGRG